MTAAGGTSAPAPTTGFGTFVVVWIGQSVSLIGSTLSGFALGIYVYRLTGSATTLGLVFALALLPAILASPIAGALVDRWGSRRALLVSNAGSMIVTSLLALLLFTDNFAVWQVYVVVAVMSVMASLEVPAFAALVPRLVPRRHLGRANGMRMFGLAASEVLAPVAGGFLLLAVDIHGIVLIDLSSFALALITLLAARLPRIPRDTATRPGGVGALLAEFRVGWQYIVARRGLLALVLFFCAVNFSAGFIDLLISPLVLSFAPPDTLGMVLSFGGVGMIISSVVVSVWGGPKHRVRGILGFSLVLGVAVVIGASRPDAVLVAVAAFAFMGSLGVVITTSQGIWQTKVDPRLLGRVSAVLNMVASAPQVVAYAVAGLAVDRVFEPLVGHDEVRSPALAAVIGDGPGRGIALLMMIMGGLIAVSVVVAATNPRLRRLETEIPDAVSDSEDDRGSETTPLSALAGPEKT
ncbi:MFS transporter [Micromonospora echinospora]|uniref:Predicted arabinose efflux permease, MFS family n=1 Tax=Micromonospora echinospora TaxID=1877 RepID=A0A1C4YSL1_MICEC|nr:MFS transporter [Micromonospora echinospora]OZV77375.1 MFS transporter [Micromonospora echinospora]SCF23650.1 Predicted arabinose efflux permease, MFS family [Micromonospora echinospora]